MNFDKNSVIAYHDNYDLGQSLNLGKGGAMVNDKKLLYYTVYRLHGFQILTLTSKPRLELH